MNATLNCPLPGVIDVTVGAPGVVRGVTEADAVDALLVPELFVAVTVNVYAVPFVNPVTVQNVVADVHVPPPGDAVTV